MSQIDEKRASDVREPADKGTQTPTEYAPMPIFLPLMFIIVFGFIIAYSVVSK